MFKKMSNLLKMIGKHRRFFCETMKTMMDVFFHDNTKLCFFKKHQTELSHEKNPPTFHYTGWLIGILIMVYYNPYITG